MTKDRSHDFLVEVVNIFYLRSGPTMPISDNTLELVFDRKST